MTDKPSLRETTSKGVLWSAFEKLSVKGIQFIIGIILARLLMPKDFGLVGMIAIFIAISQTFIDSGMGAGLIQKQNRSKKDFSTVFVFNLLLSFLCYVLLYSFAPYISKFYNEPSLNTIIKVVGINIVVNSLAIVQRTRLIIDMDFKTLARVKITSEVLSGSLAIFLAYNGFGVWALVFKQILDSFVSVLLFWYLGSWKVSFKFSKESFRSLFRFGSNFLLAGIFGQLMDQIHNVFIGKYYSASQLGYYTQGKQLAEVPAQTFSNILNQVTFPLFASLQNEKTRMSNIFRRIVKMNAFIIFPMMTGISILSDPIITLFLGKNWLFAIPLMQWMCLARIFHPLGVINLELLNANGRSDLWLKVDLMKAPLSILILLITLPISVEAMVIGQVITALIGYFINAYMPGKLFNCGAVTQIRDILHTIFLTLFMAMLVYWVISFIESDVIKIIVGISVGLISYLGVAQLLKFEEIKELKNLLSRMKSS